MKKLLFVTIIFLTLVTQGCSSKPRELKSPCVGLESSPCGKRDANPWLHNVSREA